MPLSAISEFRFRFVMIVRIVLIVLITLCELFLAACQKERASSQPIPEVEVMQVIERDIPIVQEWVGTADGLVNATIRAQVTGYLISQNYREGESVRKGQVLFEIDPRPFGPPWTRPKANLPPGSSVCQCQGQSGQDQAPCRSKRGKQERS